MKSIKTPVLACSVAAMGILVGCTSTKVDVVTPKIQELVKNNRFDDARNLKVETSLLGKTEEEKTKETLLSSVVAQAEKDYIAKKTEEIQRTVENLLKQGKDEQAREYIYKFGVSGQPTVDNALYLVKAAVLNSLVNPASYNRIVVKTSDEVKSLIEKKEFPKAKAKIDLIKEVCAYDILIDKELTQISDGAIKLLFETALVNKEVDDFRRELYSLIAPREGYLKRDTPSLNPLKKHFDIIKDTMIDEDVPEEEAEKRVMALYEGIKKCFDDHATKETYTTKELNELIANARKSLTVSTNDAILKTAAEAEIAKVKDMLALVNTGFESVIDARIEGFVNAINDREEAAINKVLGEGARVLRTYRKGAKMTKDEATSLLVASVYMGYEDSALKALEFGADINGTSKKDDLARTPYLIALQYGFKDAVKSLLQNCNKSLRDTNGYGEGHYLIKYKNTTFDFTPTVDFKTAGKDGVTPLMLAAAQEDLTYIIPLIALSDVNAVSSDGKTALYYATEAGNQSIVELLVKAKTDVTKKTKTGKNVLDAAVDLPSEKILHYYLDEVKMAPTDISVVTCINDNRVITLNKLVEKGAKITNKHLAAAVALGRLEMVKYLISLGTDVNSTEVHSVITKGGKVFDLLRQNGYRK